MSSYVEDKNEILTRLRKMEGQLQGIQRMIKEDRYCVDVLNQLSSIVAAAHRVSSLILGDHIRGCVRTALKSDDERSEESVSELLKVVERFTSKR